MSELTEGQTHRGTDKQYIQTIRQTDRQTNSKQQSRKSYLRHTCEQLEVQIAGQPDKQIYRQKDKHTDEKEKKSLLLNIM